MYHPPLSFELATLAVQLAAIAAQVHPFLLLRERFAASSDPASNNTWAAALLWLALPASLVLAGCSELLDWDQLLIGSARAPVALRLVGSAWVAGCVGAYFVILTLRTWRRYQARPQTTGVPGDAARLTPPALSRRRLVSNLTQVAVAAPFVMGGYGVFVGRKDLELREVDVPITGLAESLDGLRLTQISDLHCSSYLTPSDVRRVVHLVNETHPDLAFVTGDLITLPGDPLGDCIDVLSEIKAAAGVFGCMGNHESYALSETRAEDYGRATGLEFLRQRSEVLEFGKTRLNLCGVDYQRKAYPYLQGAERMVKPGSLNVLLTHNPDVFPVAAEMGYDLVLAGHTHGGQVTVEILEQWANAGHFFTPFVAGEYRLGKSMLYVNRGIGTVNLPMRIGATPEVTLLTLRRA